MQNEYKGLSRPVKPEEEAPKVAVSLSAVMNRQGQSLIYLVREGRAVEAPIRLGSPLGEMVEVQGGVKPGEKIVVNPPSRLKDGAKVKTLER